MSRQAPARRAPRRVAIGALVATALLVSPAGAGAAVSLPGSPLVVSVGPDGECQSSYVNAGNDFYPANGTVGDCGFFLGFPSSGNPASLREKVFGFAGVEGPRLESTEYVPVSPGSPTGSGTAADPYRLVTQFKVSDEGLDYALITETTTYVDGEPQFSSTFAVENVTGQTIPGLTTAPAATLKFHAIYAGDLSTDDSDFGTGLFLPGPPRFVGGQNYAAGVLGGFVEAARPSPEWSDWQTGCWNAVPEPSGRCPVTSPQDGGIWAAVRAAASTDGQVFDDDIDPNMIDNASGVSWDDYLKSGLAAGQSADYSIVNRAQIPAGLSVQPGPQSLAVEQTATVTVTATDTAGTPYAGRPLVYSIGAANPKSGSVTTNASGQATISYVGTAAGTDTMQMFLDLAGTGTQEPRDPTAAVPITWLSATRPTSDSHFKIESVHASSSGTVTIVLVPIQEGTGTVEVTVPTATISRNALAARKLECKRNQVKIKGKCRPAATLSGKVTATGKAGVTLKITVRPSSKVKQALAKGRKVQLTAKLTYRSKLGGAPTVQTFHFTVKAPRKKQHHH